MNFPAVLTLGVTIIAGLLLISERLRPDLIALLVLVILGLSQVVSPGEAFAGFSGSAVITILAISMIAEGLRQTGITAQLSRQMRRVGGKTEKGLILVTLLASAGISLFMNNIAAVGVLLPAVIGLARRSRLQSSRLLMPLAYGTLLGGMATLLTTANIIVSGALREAGYAPYGLLDFLPIGAPVVIVGVVYMLWIGRRLLPNRSPAVELARAQRQPTELSSLYEIDKNLSTVLVLPGSAMAGKTLQSGGWMQALGLQVVGLIRGGRIQMAPSRVEVIQARDMLLTQGHCGRKLLEHYGLRHVATPPLESLVADDEVMLAELVLSPHTTLVGQSLKQIHFREKYGFNVLGIWREGKPVQSGIAELPLHFGDALLVQGMAAQLHVLQAEHDFIVLEDEEADTVLRPQKARLALLITLFTLSIAAIDWLPVAEVSLAGAVLMLIGGCVSMDDVYRSIEWRAIFLIAGMWPLSTAIRSTGLADNIIAVLLGNFGQISPLAFAGLLMFIAFGLTQLMGGQVAALVMAPLAISAASSTGTDPRGLGIAVALGCSLAFVTPFGHPVNIMVMSSGGYTVRDFIKVGTPLTLLVVITILFGLHFFWGL